MSLTFLAALLAMRLGAGTASPEAELIRVDEEFSAAAQKIGVGEAFLRYADPDAVMLPDNQDAVRGLEGIRKQFAGFPAGSTLAWKPFRAEVSASRDLGYTLGTYELHGRSADGQATVRYGKYCSVWKKQKDGTWKWVVDVGTASPAP